MADKRKMTAVEKLASTTYFCLIAFGFVLGATLGIQDHSVFRPLPYALGNTFDAETLQLAENYQSMKDSCHQIAKASLHGRTVSD
ncbi:MAG: hypothetical protein ACI4NO_01110 [Oxalobacter sp.]